MPKSHFFVSSDPVHFPTEYPLLAMCGQIVHHPEPQDFGDEDLRDFKFNSLRDCGKCYDKLPSPDKKLFIYAVREGAELHSGTVIEDLQELVTKVEGK